MLMPMYDRPQCYDTFAFYVDRHGYPSRSHAIDYEGRECVSLGIVGQCLIMSLLQVRSPLPSILLVSPVSLAHSRASADQQHRFLKTFCSSPLASLRSDMSAI